MFHRQPAAQDAEEESKTGTCLRVEAKFAKIEEKQFRDNQAARGCLCWRRAGRVYQKAITAHAY